MSDISNLKFHRYFSHYIFLNDKEYKMGVVTLDIDNTLVSIEKFNEETAMTLYVDRPITVTNADNVSAKVSIGDKVIIKY